MSSFFKLGFIRFSEADFDFKQIGIVRFADADFKQLASNFVLLLTLAIIFYVALFLNDRDGVVENSAPEQVRQVTPQKSGLVFYEIFLF
jgi:hypothetical protein